MPGSSCRSRGCGRFRGKRRRRLRRCHTRLCRRFLTSRFGRLVRLSRFFGGRHIAKMLAHELGVFQVNRTRVRLFFRDADFRQELDQDLSLDLQFARQFINSDLIRICHSPLSSLVLANAIHRATAKFQWLVKCEQRTTVFPRPLRSRRLLLPSPLRWPLRSLHPELPPLIRHPPDSRQRLPAAREFRPQPLAR
jgi:hypothetical protein